MQKFINNPQSVVDEMLEGFVKAHGDLVAKTENKRVLKYKEAPVDGKVGIVTGGGSGHKPAFIGYYFLYPYAFFLGQFHGHLYIHIIPRIIAIQDGYSFP